MSPYFWAKRESRKVDDISNSLIVHKSGKGQGRGNPRKEVCGKRDKKAREVGLVENG